ncbi:hypothetical protein KAJ61_00180 [Candidatus Parcubacteria bacterium]|nr:hypothetical protein [Candidatus Parcubacteria bacterium]
MSELQKEVKSGSLLQKIEKDLISEIGGESRYYKSPKENSVILLINGIKKDVDSKYVRDVIVNYLPSFNLEQEEKVDIEYSDIIFLKQGGDITTSVLNRSLFLFITVNNLE